MKKVLSFIFLIIVVVVIAGYIYSMKTYTDVVDDNMSNSRKNALFSSARTVANWYFESSVSDKFADDGEEIIHDDVYNYVKNNNNKWLCISDLSWKNSSGQTVTLFETAELSATDIVKDGTPYSGSGAPTLNTCASIKIGETGFANVVLVAEPKGKYGSTKETNYAISSMKDANQPLP